MKKYWLVVLALVMALTLCGCAAAEENVEADAPTIVSDTIESLDWMYSYVLLSDGTAMITRYHGTDEVLAVPGDFNGVTVSRIGERAFDSCKKIMVMTLPDSLVAIEDYAFNFCASLYTIEIPEGVVEIGNGAFSTCSDLLRVSLPDSLVSLGQDVNPFAFCNCLTEIIVSPTHPVLSIVDGVLFDKVENVLLCYPLGLKDQSYAVPQGVQRIGNHVFSNCDYLITVTIPGSVTTIEDSAFCNCNLLEEVVIHDGLTEIEAWAFSNCPSLTSITIPDSVTTIGDYALSMCPSLTSITIPDSVTSIGEGALNWCSSLTSITVTPGSCAHQYCQDNNLPFVLAE